MLRRQDYIDFGLAIVNGCHDTYASTLTKIGPESFSWNTTNIPANQTAFYAANGFWITNAQYILRPEVIESYYYAYQITHDPKYQDWAWDAFVAINATTRTGSGFTEINDVNAPAGGGFRNFQDSFLFAEVMKYSYLIQAPVSILAVHTIRFYTEVLIARYSNDPGMSTIMVVTSGCSIRKPIRSELGVSSPGMGTQGSVTITVIIMSMEVKLESNRYAFCYLVWSESLRQVGAAFTQPLI